MSTCRNGTIDGPSAHRRGPEMMLVKMRMTKLKAINLLSLQIAGKHFL